MLPLEENKTKLEKFKSLLTVAAFFSTKTALFAVIFFTLLALVEQGIYSLNALQLNGANRQDENDDQLHPRAAHQLQTPHVT